MQANPERPYPRQEHHSKMHELRGRKEKKALRDMRKKPLIPGLIAPTSNNTNIAVDRT
jgi:hypothetical protein